MKIAVFALLLSAVSAFVPQTAPRASTTAVHAERREVFAAAAAAAAALSVPLTASALVDYENVPYLGGSDIVDLNNANVRVYLKMPGLYPSVAAKIVSHGPYKSVGEVYNIPGLTGSEKELIKKYESRFIALKPQAEYFIDRVNNGLYK